MWKAAENNSISEHRNTSLQAGTDHGYMWNQVTVDKVSSPLERYELPFSSLTFPSKMREMTAGFDITWFFCLRINSGSFTVKRTCWVCLFVLGLPQGLGRSWTRDQIWATLGTHPQPGQCPILNLLCWARDGTCFLELQRHRCSHCATVGTPLLIFQTFSFLLALCR